MISSSDAFAVAKGLRGMACAVPRDDPGLWSFVPEGYMPFCAMKAERSDTRQE